MCVCLYVHVRVHACVHDCVCMYVCLCVHVCACVPMCMITCVNARLCACMSMCTHACVCIHFCMCVCAIPQSGLNVIQVSLRSPWEEVRQLLRTLDEMGLWASPSRTVPLCPGQAQVYPRTDVALISVSRGWRVPVSHPGMAMAL